jgi:hypothetical protein
VQSNLRALGRVGQPAVGWRGGAHGRVAAAELVGHGGSTQELDGAGPSQGPKVSLAEVGVAHVDGVEEVADDGKTLQGTWL